MLAARPEPDRSAEHSGTSGPAPGAGSPKARTWIGCTGPAPAHDQQPGIDRSRRELCPSLGRGLDVLVGQQLGPGCLPAAASWRSAVRYAAGPSCATTCTLTWPGPEPKPAMTDGAYTLSMRLPNWLRTAGVTTTTWAPAGSWCRPAAPAVRGGHPLSLERRAHQRITGHDRAGSDLLRDPDGGELERSAEGLAPGRARGRRAVAGVPGVRPGQRNPPRRRRLARPRPRPPG